MNADQAPKPRPCSCEKDGCRLCYLYHHDARYRVLWGGSFDGTLRKPLPCIHLRGELGRMGCQGCQGNVEVKVFSCNLFGRCTLGKELSGVSCCATCPQREDESMRKLPWAYGVTTVPVRRTTLLERTLDSLSEGGFPHPHLFVDGAKGGYDELVSTRSLAGITYRYPAVRVYGNWILSIAELYIKNPTADRYALFQDDFIIVRGIRNYLDTCPYPNNGYWNLWSFRENELRFGSEEGWYLSGQMGRGAVALVFDKQAIQALLMNQAGVKGLVMKPEDTNFGWRKADGACCEAMKAAGYKEWIHNPSLVQHTGDLSTIGNRNQRSVGFRGVDYDPTQSLKKSSHPA